VKEKERYEAQRRSDLRKEKDISETQSLLRRGGRAGDGRSVSFMYEPPPGISYIISIYSLSLSFLLVFLSLSFFSFLLFLR
jgi:hypothetical protein